MSPNSIPLSLPELTKEWLQKVLNNELDGSTIIEFSSQIIGVGEGFMGELARIKLTFEEPSSVAQDSFIIKFAAARQDTRDMAADRNLYKREIGFYRDIGERSGISIPKCHFAHYDERSNKFVLLIEDLAPGEPSDQIHGTDRETSEKVIIGFAKLHAQWWNSKELESLDWAKWQITEMPKEKSIEMFKIGHEEAKRTGKFEAYPEMNRLMEYLPPLLKFDPAPPFPFSLTHGDLRSDNVIRPTKEGGRFAIIDWQISGIGDPISDIAYWMILSLSIEERRKTEKHLLNLYHKTLLECGVKGYGYKKFVNAYRTNIAVIQLMFSMPIDQIDDSSDRAKELFHQFYSRIDAALVDWEMEKLLRSLPYIYPFIKLVLIARKALGI